MIGVLLNFTPINPIRALYWSAVINGIVAVPVLAIMMLLTADKRLMGQFPVKGLFKIVGWIATFVMAAAVLGMGITAVIG